MLKHSFCMSATAWTNLALEMDKTSPKAIHISGKRNAIFI